MSVYTPVARDELERWLTHYAPDTVVLFSPIAAGIENTNYFVTTQRGAFVLTLYERLPATDLPFYLDLMAHLAREGIACPAPEADRRGAYFSMLNGRPAGLVSRLAGAPITAPDPARCATVGRTLARMHVAGRSYRARLTNRRGPAWWRTTARAVRPFLGAAQRDLLANEIAFQTGYPKLRLPRGAIHGDLFRDNVLWIGGRVSGIIDFGFAATDFLALDLAIAVNDWCVMTVGSAAGALDPARCDALTAAYQEVRLLEPAEQRQWPALLRAAALRFWLSRLADFHLPRPGTLTHMHDPAEFERILRHRAAFVRPPAPPMRSSAP